jgi:Transposase IS116/IS110/IS902 family
MRDQLWRYFPAILELDTDLGTEWLLELLQLVPTADRAARLRETAVDKLLKRHRIRRFDAAHVLKTLRTKPLRLAAGTTEAASAHVAILIKPIRLVNQQLKQAMRQIDVLTARLAQSDEAEPGQKKQRDVEILASLVGVGRIVLATLLAEGSDPLRRRDYSALRCLAGVAPVSRRSGKSWIVLRRYACNPRLANAMHNWARVAMQHDPKSRTKYAALRSRGHNHARALRSIADRLLNIACAMLRAGTTSIRLWAAKKPLDKRWGVLTQSSPLIIRSRPLPQGARAHRQPSRSRTQPIDQPHSANCASSASHSDCAVTEGRAA